MDQPVTPPDQQILKETDQCVLCGLCLPHCPTYHLTRNEAESPRGRISLMQALARGQLQADAELKGHLDRCLVCRSCERVCPSQVPYGKLIDEARALFAPGAAQSSSRSVPLQQLLDSVADKQGRLRQVAKGLRLYQRSGAQWLARQSGLLRGLKLDGLEQALPNVPEPLNLKSYYPPQGEKRADVALFTGCIGEMMDDGTLPSAIKLLNILGYGVQIPVSQGCCGSLHQHNGEPEQAKSLAHINVTAFNGLEVEAVIGTGSGCTAQLREYAARYGEENGFKVAVYDICDFLATIEWPEQICFRPLKQRIAIHEPCASRNLLNGMASVQKLLAMIPELVARPLANNNRCCGAAGSYMVTQPALADALRREKLSAITAASADAVVSTNIGCALHIQAGRPGLELHHPIALLLQQITSV
ncbi:hypothetical protein BOW53_12675 [Solemya pervernicosa gill symbiont]|uniref:Glycolate oxidase iron-sulfur subunit n=2 Tax=Gammaproteobacteria incertae sedis TaxID=118884 RepID=A0A1T2L294_9GAMM|nr:(Fe-S)-binding protein [Candidatus Reidiella endopervernicosa]OOZ39150.1 hypothetical protein BOW53_12675 [Solemya pervernicosa gill symbiont]QKQ28025.1 (Fe-S)-binding protein [Candidatus Reidiella endopervernicosa]